MSTAKNVTVIPATLNIHTRAPMDAPVKRRVAGYARVSTGSEEQATSYEAQVDYYTNYIKSRGSTAYLQAVHAGQDAGSYCSDADRGRYSHTGR